jgi:general secretion pathway protein L
MPTWLGIDIGRAGVKVAVVRSAYRKITLEGLFAIAVEEGSDPSSAVRTAVSAALGGAAAGDGLAVAIDGSRVAVCTLKLPASVQKQLGDVLPFELEAQVPLEISESVFDYRVLASDAPVGDEEQAFLSVLVAVARTEDVRSRIEFVKAAAGAEPERVEVGGLSIANLVPHMPVLGEEGPIVVIDLGAWSSEVVVLKAGEPVFARTLSHGTVGLPASAALLGREIRVSIGAFRAAGGSVPTHVYLCGDGAFESGAASFLSGELSIPCEELPAPSIDLGAVDPESARGVARFAKAIGLALGMGGRPAGFDLRRGPLAYERGFAWVREKVPVLAGLVAAIAVSFLFSAWAQLHAASNDREVLEKSLGVVTKEVLGEETTTAARANELLGQQTALSDEDPLPHADAFDVMVKLSEDIPQSMVHDIEELDVQKAHVVVHGIVGSIPDAQSIAGSLRAETCFADVKITRTTQVIGGDRQKYVLDFDEKCPEDAKGGGKKKEGAPSAAPSSSSGGEK